MKNNYFADFEAFRCADSELRQVLGGGTWYYYGFRWDGNRVWGFSSTSENLIIAWCDAWGAAGYNVKMERRYIADEEVLILCDNTEDTGEYAYDDPNESYEG